MVRESSSHSSHELVKTLRFRIRHLEQFYIVLSGSYGISLANDDPRSTMIALIEEISRLFEELEQCSGSKREFEQTKEDYNRMVKRWEQVFREKEQSENSKFEKAKRIFDRLRSK